MELFNIDKNKVLALVSDEKISRQFAQDIIKYSIFWTHPSGHIVPAPKHYKHIYIIDNGNYEIGFGANIFEISEAIIKCQKVLLEYCNTEEKRQHLTLDDIKISLKQRVKNSVKNYQGDNYGIYPCYGLYMKFGVTLINVDRFVDFIINFCLIYKKKNSHIKKCYFCGKKFDNSSKLRYHINFYHNSDRINVIKKQNSSQQQLESQKWSSERLCPYCSIRLKQDQLGNHINQFHQKEKTISKSNIKNSCVNNLVKCPYCSSRVKKNRLDKHIKKVHKK
jgi:uncharacterized Zn-finger protein